MTPTEQDNELLNASDELRVDLVTAPEEMCEHGVNLRLCQCHRCDGTAIYTEADMKRVALEARMDELKKVDMLTKPLLPNSGSVETNVKAWVKDRLPQLKAQQEEL